MNEAFVLSVDDFNNKLKTVKIIAKQHGFLKTFIRKDDYNKNLQVGSFITYNLEQKTPDSVSFISCEVVKSFLNDIYFNKQNLYCFNSACSIFNKLFLYYNSDMANIYLVFRNMIFSFCEDNNNFLMYNYVDFLLNVVEFFGVNKIQRGGSCNNKNTIIVPDSFFTFQMTQDELKYFVQNINKILQNILTYSNH
ncbi:MAG: hypothetical protein LBG48_02050 [Rickettsiales bacterium]|jgi:recombinational DNA repair protein (RecF pathway)|nr:hypothetical protein [Rickettsiales bacterium]